MPRWEHFPHDADVGVRGVGDSMEQAFEQAALAVSVLTVELDAVEPRERVEVSGEAPDDEQLLVEWLDSVIFEMMTRNMVFRRFEVVVDGSRLRGALWGEPRDDARHVPGVEVKGATFTELKVREEDGKWITQCVVDV